MKLKNEDEVLKALGIPSWGALTPEHIPELTKLIPVMDRDLAAKILPKLSADVVQEVSSMGKAVVESNDRNQGRLHEIDLATIGPLADAYARAQTPEEWNEHWERIREVRREKQAKDTENKAFWLDIMKLAIGGAALLLLAALYAARNDGDQAQGLTDFAATP